MVSSLPNSGADVTTNSSALPDAAQERARWIASGPIWDRWSDPMADMADRLNLPLLDACGVMPGERVLLQHGLSLRRKRRKALSHVRHPGRQPDPRIGRDRDQTDSPRISRASASRS